MQTTLDQAAKSERTRHISKSPKIHKISKRLTSDTLAELVAAYEDGIPTTALTKRYQLGKGTVLKLLHEHSVTMRRQGFPAGRLQEAIRLYVAGWSTKRIGDHMGCDAETVRKTLRTEGVQMRQWYRPSSSSG